MCSCVRLRASSRPLHLARHPPDLTQDCKCAFLLWLMWKIQLYDVNLIYVQRTSWDIDLDKSLTTAYDYHGYRSTKYSNDYINT
jgi:hypothetical protein